MQSAQACLDCVAHELHLIDPPLDATIHIIAVNAGSIAAFSAHDYQALEPFAKVLVHTSSAIPRQLK